MKCRSVEVLMIMALLLNASFAPTCAYAQSSDAVFQKAVAEYQKSPTTDTADKVTKLAVAMDKLPPVPEEARKHFVKGAALFKEAKSQEDFTQVLDEFTQAVHLAPWWPEARYNQALACEAASEYAGAIENLKLYRQFKLPDAETRSVQDKIYVLEAKMEKAAKATSPEAVAAQEQKKSEDWLKKLDGRRYAFRDGVGNEHTLDVRGKVLVWNASGSRSSEWGRFEIRGREFTYPSPLRPDEEFTFIISDDGDSITERVIRYSDGAKAEYIYLWQR